jgi:hypothetical protein
MKRLLFVVLLVVVIGAGYYFQTRVAAQQIQDGVTAQTQRSTPVLEH